jgi:hypothetical protein
MEQSAEGATVFCEVPKFINGSLNITAIHISTLLYFSSLKIICGDWARRVEISKQQTRPQAGWDSQVPVAAARAFRNGSQYQ